jgi:hypothetical protein
MILAHATLPWFGTMTSMHITVFFFPAMVEQKKNTWMTQPTGDIATINYKRGEKRKKDMIEKEKEEDKCVENQRSAQDYGYCCHQHATVAKKEHI